MSAPLSALYGTAGKTHHVGMLTLLLEAGPTRMTMSRLPLGRKPRLHVHAVIAGIGRTQWLAQTLSDARLTTANCRRAAMLQLGGDANERPWIHHAILRGRSIDYIEPLVSAGADLRATDRDGTSLYR